jgi:hypothetical protein
VDCIYRRPLTDTANNLHQDFNRSEAPVPIYHQTNKGPIVTDHHLQTQARLNYEYHNLQPFFKPGIFYFLLNLQRNPSVWLRGEELVFSSFVLQHHDQLPLDCFGRKRRRNFIPAWFSGSFHVVDCKLLTENVLQIFVDHTTKIFFFRFWDIPTTLGGIFSVAHSEWPEA